MVEHRRGSDGSTVVTEVDGAKVEPRDHLTWALLGDLSARRGKFRQARAYYKRSLALNPRNPFVRALVENPRSAISQTAQ